MPDTMPDTVLADRRVTYLAILAGGALGSLLRALLWAPEPGWVTSSALANALACLVIGYLYAMREAFPARALAFGAIGFCGGLSTFSAFAVDLAGFAGSGDGAGALVAAGVEIALGLGAALVGAAVGRARHARRGAGGSRGDGRRG